VKDFQKVAATDSFENALIMIQAHLLRGDLDNDQLKALQIIHSLTAIEIGGIIIDRLGGILNEGKVEANSLAAAQLINAIQKGEDGENVQGAVKKIIFELQKD
jgi:hypothetical protein